MTYVGGGHYATSAFSREPNRSNWAFAFLLAELSEERGIPRKRRIDHYIAAGAATNEVNAVHVIQDVLPIWICPQMATVTDINVCSIGRRFYGIRLWIEHGRLRCEGDHPNDLGKRRTRVSFSQLRKLTKLRFLCLPYFSLSWTQRGVGLRSISRSIPGTASRTRTDWSRISTSARNVGS